MGPHPGVAGCDQNQRATLSARPEPQGQGLQTCEKQGPLAYRSSDCGLTANSPGQNSGIHSGQDKASRAPAFPSTARTPHLLFRTRSRPRFAFACHVTKGDVFAIIHINTAVLSPHQSRGDICYPQRGCHEDFICKQERPERRLSPSLSSFPLPLGGPGQPPTSRISASFTGSALRSSPPSRGGFS